MLPKRQAAKRRPALEGEGAPLPASTFESLSREEKFRQTARKLSGGRKLILYKNGLWHVVIKYMFDLRKMKIASSDHGLRAEIVSHVSSRIDI
jgi:hypothetical protein